MSLTNLLLPTYMQMLQALSTWLDSAGQQGPEADIVLTRRLAPDMLPLASQVRFACFQAQEATFRLRGMAVPDTLTAVAREGQRAGEEPGTLADSTSRIAEALAFLSDLDPDTLDAGAVLQIELALPNGMIFELSGGEYVRDWALPQFYFHLVTAYAILRGQGVALGKADYVPHMFAHLRPGTGPEG